jgi:hypothetical protein
VSTAWTILATAGGLSWDAPVEFASAVASPLVFLCACAVVFFGRRIGYGLGLTAGVIFLPWFVRIEFFPAFWNSWVYFNYGSPTPGEEGLPTFAMLRVLSEALALVAIACASVRLLPARWSLRGTPLCRPTWPAFAVASLAVAIWFAHSVTPYTVPGFFDGAAPEFQVLHVVKRATFFHETMASASRNGRVWISRDDRRLIHYRFERRIARATMPYERVAEFVQSPKLWKLHTQPAKALWAWNAEGWYVVLKDSRLLAFTSEYGTAPPREIIDLFQEIENLPASEERPSTVRDVCLGFLLRPRGSPGIRAVARSEQTAQ